MNKYIYKKAEGTIDKLRIENGTILQRRKGIEEDFKDESEE